MKQLGVALVGLGPGSQPHIASLRDLRDELDLRWAICRDPSRVPAGPLDNWVTPSTDLDRALSDPRVDMVIVATPAATHLDIAGRSLAAGKHTLVEKPLEVSLARAQELVQRAESSGLRFGVVLQHRLRPGAQRLRELLASGDLGEIQAASLTVPWWRSQAGYYDAAGRGTRARDGGGVLLTQAIHAIDLFRSLLGVKQVVAAQVITTDIHAMETEDYVAALLTLDNGAPGSITATTASYPGRAESLEIICLKATARLQGGRLDVHFHDGRHISVEAEGKSGSGDSIMDFSPAAHKALISDFAQAVRSERQPLVTGMEALKTHQLIELIIAAAVPK
ncbi:Gfo/Idh/MocA family oxidoreductase [Candidimonas sp. SYP-B2681]|uniref:Gfo/Idh/MocA family protein n=1 Tax=Candidimonas sp. SYP-B2681 TaxID=2497686 RepID=UPI000F87199D|nr:Gfo/Idh/MocA family oxidoreductase [Candidimonas sp. SYP-B2681]RTZ45390.1 Gfo/Idh/MocA family oxidoreductase [Candidimonas sp. SYP-B2681]